MLLSAKDFSLLSLSLYLIFPPLSLIKICWNAEKKGLKYLHFNKTNKNKDI